MDRVSFSFKGIPTLTVKGQKVDLSKSQDTLKLPNGKTIKGFRADDGTFFQLKKKGSGDSATNQIIVHGEKANLAKWNFKVRGGALTKFRFADGQRFRAGQQNFQKEKTFTFDRTFKPADHGLGAYHSKKTGLDVDNFSGDFEMREISLEASRKNKRALVLEGLRDGDFDHLGIKGDHIEKLASFLDPDEMLPLYEHLRDSGDPETREPAKEILKALDQAWQKMDTEGRKAIESSLASPTDTGKRQAAEMFFRSALED